MNRQIKEHENNIKREVVNLMNAISEQGNNECEVAYIEHKRDTAHRLLDTYINVCKENRGYNKRAFQLPDMDSMTVEHEQAFFAIRWDLEEMLDLLSGAVVYVGDTAWMYWREEVLTIVVNDSAIDYSVKMWKMIELVEDARL